jgi:hypothetical protein
MTILKMFFFSKFSWWHKQNISKKSYPSSAMANFLKKTKTKNFITNFKNIFFISLLVLLFFFPNFKNKYFHFKFKNDFPQFFFISITGGIKEKISRPEVAKFIKNLQKLPIYPYQK